MIQIYHPSKSGKGFAASFWYSERDDSVFATIIKQSGYDEKTQNGVFKGNKNDPTGKVNVKLDYFEVAGILNSIEKNHTFSKPHDTEETFKQISFSPWKNQDGTQKGFSFSITSTNKQNPTIKNSFYIGFTYDEARLIREFLVYTLHSHFQKIKDYKSKIDYKSETAPKQRVQEPEPNDEPPVEDKPVTEKAVESESEDILNF